ncbi:hypothetical protein CRENBAI_009013 [Crenichthys baileyi]|uniref:Uncharacterized protein n=1 Tax=Crenichthys baileyi TaxID=28760 RepID=A0AAV9RUP4_9TELE
MNIWGYLKRKLPALIRSSVSHLWSTDSSGSDQDPSFQTTELQNETRQQIKKRCHSYPLRTTPSWQLPGPAFHTAHHRRTLSTLHRASPSAQTQHWIISSHSQGPTFRITLAARPRLRIPLIRADIIHCHHRIPSSLLCFPCK